MPESTFTFQNTEYTFSPERDIGIVELRHIKNWYGPDLGSYNGLTQGASFGDPDALSCIIWIAMRKSGQARVLEPMRLPDFSIGEFMGSFVTDGMVIRTKMPPMHLVIDGVPYTFDLETQLTRDTLQAIKTWYPDMGGLVSFTYAFLRGDPDAMACVAWIVRRAAGEEDVPEPRLMDFAVGEVIESYEMDEPETPEEPPVPVFRAEEQEEVDPPLPSDGGESSVEIPTLSGGSTAPKSPISSASRPRSKKPVHS